MPSKPPKPYLYNVPGGVLALSGIALQEFLRAVLARGASFRFKARGYSMHPFIQNGDVLTVSPKIGGKPRLGEVAAFCHPETRKLIVHRVLAQRDDGYLFRGDNAAEPDGLISTGDILGRVTRVERNGHRVRLGLGWERLLITCLCRYNLLQPLLVRVRQVLQPLRPGGLA